MQNNKTAMAASSKAPRDNWIPGLNLFLYGSKSEPEFNDLHNEIIQKYEALTFSSSLSISEKVSEHITLSNGYKFKILSTDDISDYPNCAPESIKIGSTSLSLGYSNSDWNGVFMSTNSASISAEIGLTDSKYSDFRFPMNFSFSISEQHPIFSQRLRMYQKISGLYGKKNHSAQFESQSAGAVTILPGNFSTERIIGGNLGFEIAVAKFTWGMISLYSDYQIVYTKEYTALNDGDYEFEHGSTGGTRLYLAKIAFPALAMGLSYNVPHNRWQFSASIGATF